MQFVTFSDVETFGGVPACRLALRLRNDQFFRIRFVGQGNFDSVRTVADVFRSLTTLRRGTTSPTQRVCATCKHVLDQPVKFCPYCGVRQEETTAHSTPETATPPPPAPASEARPDFLDEALSFLSPEPPKPAQAPPATEPPPPTEAPPVAETPPVAADAEAEGEIPTAAAPTDVEAFAAQEAAAPVAEAPEPPAIDTAYTSVSEEAHDVPSAPMPPVAEAFAEPPAPPVSTEIPPVTAAVETPIATDTEPPIEAAGAVEPESVAEEPYTEPQGAPSDFDLPHTTAVVTMEEPVAAPETPAPPTAEAVQWEPLPEPHTETPPPAATFEAPAEPPIAPVFTAETSAPAEEELPPAPPVFHTTPAYERPAWPAASAPTTPEPPSVPPMATFTAPTELPPTPPMATFEPHVLAAETSASIEATTMPEPPVVPVAPPVESQPVTPEPPVLNAEPVVPPPPAPPEPTAPPAPPQMPPLASSHLDLNKPIKVYFNINRPMIQLNEVFIGENADDVIKRLKDRTAPQLPFTMRLLIMPMSPLSFAQEIVRRYNDEMKASLPIPTSCAEFLAQCEGLGFATIEAAS